MAEQKSSRAEPERTSERLKAGEETVRMVFDAVVEAMMLLDVDGNILDLNQTAAMRLGRVAGELTGANIFELLNVNLAGMYRNQLAYVLQWEIPVRFEETVGGLIFETTVHPVAGPGGKIEHLAVFSRDNTLQYRKERRMELKELKYRTLFNCLSCAAVLIDGEAGIIRESNKRAQEITGRSRSELEELHVGELFDGEIFRLCLDSPEPIEEDTPAETMTAGMITCDGSKVEVMLHAKNFFIAGEPLIMIEFHELSHLRTVWSEMADTGRG